MYRIFDSRGVPHEPRADDEAALKLGRVKQPDGDSDPHKPTGSKAPESGDVSQLGGDSDPHKPTSSKTHKPENSCDWKGDAPDPELDDLAHPPAAHDPSSHPADARDQGGDEPEQQQDDPGQVGQVGQPNSQDKQPDEHGDQIEHSGASTIKHYTTPNSSNDSGRASQGRASNSASKQARIQQKD